jgi:hypothetical protein
LEDIARSYSRKQKGKVQVECSRPEEHTVSDTVTAPSRAMPPNADNTVKVLAESGNSRKRRRLKIDTAEDRVGKAYQILRNVCERPDRDECSLYAQLLAKRLRALDENKREIVTHEINNLMFRAKMQNQNFLSLSSPYSSALGGLHSTAPGDETANYRPCSFRQDQSRTPMFIPSSESSFEVKKSECHGRSVSNRDCFP